MEVKQKISKTEVEERLKWTLQQKIDHFLYVSEAFLIEYPDAKVMFSGGLDSTVMLWLIRKFIKKDIQGVFVNTTNEFPDIIRFVKQTENAEILNPDITFKESVEKYGFPLISKRISRMVTDVRHPTGKNEITRNLYLTGVKQNGERTKTFVISDKWKKMIDAPFDITYKCCDLLKKKTLNKYSKNGKFIGTMVTDSNTRMGGYLITGCINLKKKICTPLSIFYKDEIYEIIKMFNIPYCAVYDKGETNTGCAYCGYFRYEWQLSERLKRLHQNEPKRFEMMMNLKNNGITYLQALEYTGIDMSFIKQTKLWK